MKHVKGEENGQETLELGDDLSLLLYSSKDKMGSSYMNIFSQKGMDEIGGE